MTLDLGRGVDLGDKKLADSMGQIEKVVTDLVNHEAYIMDICLQAAKTLVERNLTELGHTTHGPDSNIGGQGGGVAANPATPVIAIKLYEQTRISMRGGPGAVQP